MCNVIILLDNIFIAIEKPVAAAEKETPAIAKPGKIKLPIHEINEQPLQIVERYEQAIFHFCKSSKYFEAVLTSLFKKSNSLFNSSYCLKINLDEIFPSSFTFHSGFLWDELILFNLERKIFLTFFSCFLIKKEFSFIFLLNLI